MIDFHAHVDRDPITKEFKIKELLLDMQKNNIDQRVISTFAGGDVVYQNDAIISFVKAYPKQLIGCASINPKEDRSIEEAKRVVQFPEISLFEFDSMEHGYLPEKFDYNLVPILDIAKECGIIVKVFTGWGPRSAPQQWRKYIEKYPEVTFVIEHIGGIDFGYGCIDFVKPYDNVYLESSGQSEMTVLHLAFAQLPIHRFVFGSNYPTHFTELSIDVFNDVGFSEEDKKLFYHENAKRLLSRK
ncbi:MAG: amidohydrolase [Erysipelotrichaceae bacterium]|jgi:predicted TIM-barrel fold metal-dependent hydrolase|nr:amidohydrolase [Erysipelotrichaceae bacterium]